MASFVEAFEKMITNEGGYQLHQVKGDRGGQTFAGIARRYHPDWSGWPMIDELDLDNPQLQEHVRAFYKHQFWDRIQGDQIGSPAIANSLFDFAVNAGHRTAIKLAQSVLDAKQDGVCGPNTLASINDCDGEIFNLRFALAKVARYADIVNRDKSQNKFLLGWINRTLKDVV